MSACLECVTKSLVASEAVGFAENASMTPGQAGRLMRADHRSMLEAIRAESPGVEQRVNSQAQTLLEDDSTDIWMCCRHDSAFPEQMERLHDTPIVLYGRGDPRVFADIEETRPGVAIVGARRASAYGREVAGRFGRELASAGMTVVSGMAIGIDGAAHRGALEARGRTVAVLAGGVDRPYPPSHRRLYDQIVECGAVVSERPPGARARRWGFPARNRLVAALCRRTVFVEGTLASGARHTVEFAKQIGQDPLAVPGPVTSPLSEGPNRLITEPCGFAVASVEDILDHVFCGDREGQLSLERMERALTREDATAARLKADDDLAPESQIVLDWMRAGEVSAHSIQRSAPELSTRAVAVALGELELAGRIERDASGCYRTTDPDRADGG